jgi:hypothetical protein
MFQNIQNFRVDLGGTPSMTMESDVGKTHVKSKKLWYVIQVMNK